MVVEDDPEILQVLKHVLQDKGFEVSVAQDGNHGLAIMETRELDLVILDLMLPVRSGLLVLEWMRMHQKLSLPVIVITGNQGGRHRAYAELLGVHDYLEKPFTMDRLTESVSHLLASERV